MERVLSSSQSKSSHHRHNKHSASSDDILISDSMHQVGELNIDNDINPVRPTLQPKKWSLWLKIPLWLLLLSLLAITSAGAFAAYVYWQHIQPNLPSVSELKNIQMQVPMYVYTSDNKLVAEYGEKKRIPLTYEQFPPAMVNAILAAEDDRFFEHPGVDYQGILRAVVELIKTGNKSQGGSTITMQVARNFFLTPEKSYKRKINEIVLSLNIEKELSKEDIITLYMNKIFLGHRSYGFAAAAQTYFGKPIDELEIDEFALLAGLPKAPSNINPIANAEAAKNRRDYVLRRMYSLGYIDEQTYTEAKEKPVTSKRHLAQVEVNASHLAEMARQWAIEHYGDDVLEQGVNIYLTVDSKLEQHAQESVQRGLFNYDRRHGYRGPVAELTAEQQSEWPEFIADMSTPQGLVFALVTNWQTKTQTATLLLSDGQEIELNAKASVWAKNYKAKGRQSHLQAGDLILLEPKDNDTYLLAQQPKVQGALVSIDSKTGAVLALSGGYDEALNQFNRATQAKRQPGSSFKPFIYAAAIERGYTPATIINDAPISQFDPYNEDVWRPENYTRKFNGPTRMRIALTHSLNLVSIRIMQDIGVANFIDFAKRVGIDTKDMESIRNFSIALGTSSTNLLSHTGHYAIFANGGYRIQPYFIERVTNAKNDILYEAQPAEFCEIECSRNDAQRVISPETWYLTTNMMQDVIQSGTGRGALSLKRKDLAGKTGTTNDIKDTWFVGFNPDVVTGVWLGFDQPKNMGKRESGGVTALPVWVDFMRVALQDKTDNGYPMPESIVSKRIDPHTGELLPEGSTGGISEFFDKNNLPEIYEPDPLQLMQYELF